MATSLSPRGDHCEQIGISAKDLIAGRKLPVLPDSLISKGVAYELNNFRSWCEVG